VKDAKRIDRAINEKVVIRPLDDSDIGALSSDDSIEVLNPKVAKVRTAVARRAPTPPLRRKSRTNAPDVMSKLVSSFDPEAQQALQEQRAQHSFQTTQLLALNQQLRDANATAESLRNRLAEVERARDRAELKLELYGPAPLAGSGSGHPGKSRAQYVADEYPDLVRRGGKIRCETIYPEGGGCVEWITDTEDSDKENFDPSSSSSSSFLPSFGSSFGSSGLDAGDSGPSAARARSLSPNI
jgi:hypothetical protein